MELNINRHINRNKKIATLKKSILITLSAFLLISAANISLNTQAQDSQIETWWPIESAQVSGVQPFKTILKDQSIENYKLYWQVDNDRWNEMQNNYNEYPHKESAVDLTNWNWRSNGIYPITFIATDSNGNRLAKKTVNIVVSAAASMISKIEQQNTPQLNIQQSNKLTASALELTGAPLPNQNLNIWWPKEDVTISEREPLKAALEGNSVEDYRMYWQVDANAQQLMANNGQDWPHKESEFKQDLAARHSGSHQITFIAKDLSGNLIAHKSVNVNLRLEGSQIQNNSQAQNDQTRTQLVNQPALNNHQNTLTAATAPQSTETATIKKPAAIQTADISQTVKAAYELWKNRYITQSGAGGYLRIQRPENDFDTVSEGQGYGMLAAVFNNDQRTFDQLWNYSKSHLNTNGLMAWRIDRNNNVVDYGAASDADEDIAYGLIIADKKWGGYADEAKKMINSIYEFEVEKDTYVLKPGDRWGGSDITNPSYFAPAYYKAFAAYTANNSWHKVADKSYEIINRAINQNTGLVPDWVAADGSQPAKYYIGPHQNHFYYDAVRTPLRIAMDAKLNGDSRAKRYVNLITRFFAGKGVDGIRSGYNLNGEELVNYQDDTFISSVAAGAYASDNREFYAQAKSKMQNTKAQTYYGSSLMILSEIFTAGLME